MIKSEILRDIQLYADAQRYAGAAVIIDYLLPTIAVDLAEGDTFFFQGEEASNMLAEIERIDRKMDPGDMILWMARGW